MDFSIVSILLVDGLTNGAIYALLGLATVLVFAVTRVIFIPQGEFVAYGALTLALFQTGKVPGTVWLLLLLATVAALMEGVSSGAVSNQVNDVANAEVIMVIGANPTSNHPVAATWMKNAVKRGATLIVADPRRGDLARGSEIKYGLLPKLEKNHGLKKDEMVVSESAIRDIVRYYTREAGVRALEREQQDLDADIRLLESQIAASSNLDQIQRDLGVTAMPHLTCVAHTRAEIEAIVARYEALIDQLVSDQVHVRNATDSFVPGARAAFAAEESSGSSPRSVWSPERMSSPAVIAARIVARQLGGSFPPVGAIPMSSAWGGFGSASAASRAGPKHSIRSATSSRIRCGAS